MMSIIQPFIDFGNFFFPRSCISCSKVLAQKEMILCLDCIASLPRTEFHLINDNPIEKIFWGRIMAERAYSFLYFTKKSHVQKLLHNLKYKGGKDIGYALGLWYAGDLKKAGDDFHFDYVVPVPLHPKKLKKRGYNQSYYIAKGLAEGLVTKVDTENLIRSIFNPTQTKKSKYQRWENVSGIFNVLEKDKYSNCHIALVDDVITTGSTIEACFLALSECSNIRISIISLAFASS